MQPSAGLLLLLALPACLGLCPPGTPRCHRKCCPLGKAYLDGRCVKGGSPLAAPEGLGLVHARPSCQMYPIELDEEHTIHDNGTVLYDGELMEYCREWVHNGNNSFTFVCFPPEDDYSTEDATLQAYSFGMFLSFPFLLTTFLVYACFKQLNGIHDRCVMFHTFSMLLAYVCLMIVQQHLMEDEVPCVVIGYAIQFFFMATFFWLNVMCFDIYWAFSGLKSLTGSVKERDRKKLILYSIYAWGAPLLILLITLAIDYSPAIPDSSPFKPKVGVEKCFFISDFATGIYFYSPMGIVILINIVLFSVTAVRIFTLRRETKVLNREDSRKHTNSTNDKERFTLYLKLFIVMGINWVMELISFLAGGPIYLWYIPDFTNTLQGVFIFIIFVWKKRVKRLIWAKLRSCAGKGDVSNGSKSPWTASTRNTSTSGTSQNNTNSIKMQPIPEPNPSTPQINTVPDTV